MNINFEYNQVKSSERLEKFALSKLEKIQKRYGDILVATDIYFKSENTTSRDTGMICGIRANVKTGTLFTESSKGTFDEAISESVDELGRQLRKTKEKLRSY